MIGLMVITAFVIWLIASIFLSIKITSWLSARKFSDAIGFVIFPIVFFAPVADEFVGKYQFESLCKSNGIESADITKAIGKKVKVKYGERSFVEKTILPIKQNDVYFSDAETGEIVIQHKNYYAKGGWLMRYTPLSMGYSQPMLFAGNSCGLSARRGIFRKNSITLIRK